MGIFDVDGLVVVGYGQPGFDVGGAEAGVGAAVPLHGGAFGVAAETEAG